eukprot:786064-Rhodomonas_salina.6
MTCALQRCERVTANSGVAGHKNTLCDSCFLNMSGYQLPPLVTASIKGEVNIWWVSSSLFCSENRAQTLTCACAGRFQAPGQWAYRLHALFDLGN